jgi:hypothetical protein
MEQLKRNREQREATREDLEMIERDLERRKGSDWRITLSDAFCINSSITYSEDKFQLQQVKLRMAIRIKEDRPEPIDLLSRLICIF